MHAPVSDSERNDNEKLILLRNTSTPEVSESVDWLLREDEDDLRTIALRKACIVLDS